MTDLSISERRVGLLSAIAVLTDERSGDVRFRLLVWDPVSLLVAGPHDATASVVEGTPYE